MSGQVGYNVRFDWGPHGASALAADADVAVIVDVLSFTTTLSVAVDAGTVVFPFPWHDDRAQRFAQQHDAVLAVPRSVTAPGQISLSPMSVRSAPGCERLVLPSANGSAISHQLGGRTRLRVVGGSLRNAGAVADWISENYRDGALVAVIAAGERWRDGSLRPAAEDAWGAGAVIQALLACPWARPSPEAELAEAAYAAVRGREHGSLLACASGRELVDAGFRGDVDVAAEVGASVSIPLLRSDRFVPAGEA